MKKFLSYIGIAILFTGIFNPVFVNAQSDPNFVGPVQTNSFGTCTVIDTTPNAGRPETHHVSQDICYGFISPTKTVTWFADGDTAANAKTLTHPSAAPGCFSLTNFSMSDCLVGVLGWVSLGLMHIMSLILFLAGKLLDTVITYTVVHMSANISGLTGINITWKAIRDIMNLVFIFMLIYEGIKLIISKSSSGEVKNLIVGIVMASILVNFSLFFTKLLIDSSNIVTIGFYNSIVGPDSAPSGTLSSRTLSNAYQQALGLQGWYSSNAIPATFKGPTDGGSQYDILTVGVMTSILFLITTFAFLAISVMFVVRYIVLLILLILSPIAYMGLAFNGLKKYAGQWWDSLWGQWLFGPIYMIMTWVIMTLLLNGGFIPTKADEWANLLKGSAPSLDLLLNFAIVIGLSIASLAIAKGQATKGAGQIGKMIDKGTSWAGNAVMGTASSVGRKTFGLAGNAVANSETLKKLAASEATGLGGFTARKFGKAAIKVGDRTAKSSFDIRSTNLGGGLIGATSVNFGKGADRKKVNYQKDLENDAKKEAEFAKLLKPSDDAADKEKNKMAIDAGYKNYEEWENANKEKKGNYDNANLNLVELKAKAEKLEKDFKEAKLKEMQDSIQEELNATKEQIKTEEANVKNLKTASDDADKARKAADEEVKGIFGKRVTAYANSFAKESAMWTYTKDVLKVLGGATVGSVAGSLGVKVGGLSAIGAARTPAENRAIARQIRKVSKDKTPDEIIAEQAAKKAREERKAAKDRGETPEGEEEEAPPAPVPAANPPPTT